MESPFFCDFEQFNMYPFDQLNFKNRFELSHFDLLGDVFRFEMLPTTVNMVSWKEKSDFLPDFDLDYTLGVHGIILEKLYECKESKDKKQKTVYHPGYTLHIKTIRDPLPNLIKYMFPCLVLGLSLVCTFLIAVGEVNNRLGCLSVALLAYVNILATYREEIPPLDILTRGDWLLIIFIITSCFPVCHLVVYMFQDETNMVENVKLQRGYH